MPLELIESNFPLISVSALKNPGDMGLEFVFRPVDFGVLRQTHKAVCPSDVGTVPSSTTCPYSFIRVESV